MKPTSILFLTLCYALLPMSCDTPQGERGEISLNGEWDITKTGTIVEMPSRFESKVPVPGLVDMAQPAIDLGSAFNHGIYWYRTGFTLQEEIPGRALLIIGKAKYHARIYLNGRHVGEHHYCFTSGEFDIRQYLNPPGELNQLVIGVGTSVEMPDSVIWGHDFEKLTYIPGIYDDVKLILSGLPAIRRIQTVPLVEEQKVRVIAEIESGEGTRDGANEGINEGGSKVSSWINSGVRISYRIRELGSGKVVARGNTRESDFTVRIPDANLWTPENPFLYELTVSTDGDASTVRFGMRDFRFDAESGRAMLNGKPYFMRGTNVCIFRFFEDPDRGALPWDEQWVIKLHERFKSMHWNSIRYCIGFPPERWYEIVDSLGFLIQDEYPIWTVFSADDFYPAVEVDHMASEFRTWVRERWNHPSVVIWDAQNESVYPLTGLAISAVREMDLSDRPWENGWSAPLQDSDPMETHPYYFLQYMREGEASDKGILSDILCSFPGGLGNSVNEHDPPVDGGIHPNPSIINEYAWLWLNRDGTPTTMTDRIYEEILDSVGSAEERFEIYARNLGILTEYWRAQRSYAGVLHFCGLAYSRSEDPRGQTSDHFTDIATLEFEPNFVRFVKPAFSPVGLTIRFWDNWAKAGRYLGIDVVCINDLGEEYAGTLELNWEKGIDSLPLASRDISIPAYERITETIQVKVPDDPGDYALVAALNFRGETVRSVREITVEE